MMRVQLGGQRVQVILAQSGIGSATKAVALSQQLLAQSQQSAASASDDATTAQTAAAEAVAATANKVDLDGGNVASPAVFRNAIDVDGYGIPAERFFTGSLAYGDDISLALNLAAEEAYTQTQNTGTSRKVLVPIGDLGKAFNVSSPIELPPGVNVDGGGRFRSVLRRTGTFSTFKIGDPTVVSDTVQSVKVRGVCAFHDHGYGFFDSITPGAWANRLTSGQAHFEVYSGVSCEFEDIQLNNMPYSFIFQGGSAVRMRSVHTLQTWDPENASLQEGIATFLIDQDPALTDTLPTWFDIENCTFSGRTRTGVTVSYPGGFSKTATRNIGAKSVGIIRALENGYYNKNYSGGQSQSGLRFETSASKFIGGVFGSDNFFDPVGTTDDDAAIVVVGSAGVVDGLTLTNTQGRGQTNGLRFFTDKNSTSTAGSIKDLVLTGGLFVDYVGNPFDVYNVRGMDVTGCKFRNYNCSNFYSDARRTSAGWVNGTSARNINIVGGSAGGDQFGVNSGTNYCVNGWGGDAPLTVNLTVHGLGNAGLSGKLFYGDLDQASIGAQTVNYNLTAGVNAPNQFQVATLVANITATLLPSVPTGLEKPFTIARSGGSSGGPWTLTVQGLSAVALAQGQASTFIPCAGVGWLQSIRGTLG